MNNGADGEAVLFLLVECYPNALVEVDGEGRTPVDLLERVGKGRAGGGAGGGNMRRGKKGGESIMYFMRRQMMLQQEQAKRTRERRGVFGVGDTDEGIGAVGTPPAAAIAGAPSSDMDADDQREERSVAAAARARVAEEKALAAKRALEAAAAGTAAALVSGARECTLSLASCVGRWGGLCADTLDGRSPPVSVRMRDGSQLVERYEGRQRQHAHDRRYHADGAERGIEDVALAQIDGEHSVRCLGQHAHLDMHNFGKRT